MLALAFFVVFTFKKGQIALSAKWPTIEMSPFEKIYKEDPAKL